MTDLDDALLQPPEGFDERHLWHDEPWLEPLGDSSSTFHGPGPWAITDYPPDARDKIASWAMRRLGAAEAEVKRLQDAARAERERIDQWLEDSTRGPERDAEFFRGALVAYLHAIRAERGEDPDKPITKSYRLPTGTIVGRQPPEAIVVLDEEKFIEWAHTSGNEELLRVRTEVDKAAIKRLKVAQDGVSVLLEGGERVMWAEAKRGPERFDAKPSVS